MVLNLNFLAFLLYLDNLKSYIYRLLLINYINIKINVMADVDQSKRCDLSLITCLVIVNGAPRFQTIIFCFHSLIKIVYTYIIYNFYK